MRAWTRVFRQLLCGNCSHVIEAGVVALEVGDAKVVRCAACAVRMFGEAAPELPEVQTGTLPLRMPRQQDFVRAKSLVADYKAQQAGKA